jgi:hypothetical protein
MKGHVKSPNPFRNMFVHSALDTAVSPLAGETKRVFEIPWPTQSSGFYVHGLENEAKRRRQDWTAFDLGLVRFCQRSRFEGPFFTNSLRYERNCPG